MTSRIASTAVHAAAAALLAVSVAGTSGRAASLPRPASPETVMITFRAKAGAVADLERVIAAHWATARRLDLVQPAPHLTLRVDTPRGGVLLVDMFTWRDGSLPDHAPAEIQAIWSDMQRLTEARDGHPGIEIVPAAVVAPLR